MGLALALLAISVAPLHSQQTQQSPAGQKVPAAQQPPSSPAPPSGDTVQTAPIKVDVKVVNILATVRDKKNQIVNNLGKDDFTLQVDDRDQPITYFSRESDLPLTMGLLVDTSGSVRPVLGEERNAAYSFLSDMMRQDKDKAFVLHFDREVELLQDVTTSRPKLEKALDLLTEPELERADTSGNGGNPNDDPNLGGRRRGGFNGGSTQLYDAIFLASDEVIHSQQGRKALIVLSDGADRGSKESLGSAVEAAQRADTVIYSIYFQGGEQQFSSPFGGFGGRGGRGGRGGGGNRFPANTVDGKKVLEEISRETGGRMFEISKKDTIEQIYDSIAEELRNQYSVGFAPGADVGLGYHKLRLTAKQKDMTVEAREAFYSLP